MDALELLKEEEKEMFPKVKKIYDKEQLGQELGAAKQEFQKGSQKRSATR